MFDELIQIDKSAGTPVYLQITQAVVLGIRQGKLRKGLRLPGARRLADLLGINRLTVAAAFNELEAQGWLEIRPQKGAFVKVNLPMLSPKKLTDSAVASLTDSAAVFHLPEKPGFTYEEKKILPYYSQEFPPAGKLVIDDGFPDPRLAPIEDLVRCIRSFSRLSFNKKYLTYGGSQGTFFLRETLAAFLNDTRGLSITPENILITKGTQMGLYIAASLLIRRDQVVIVGTPGYARANHTFQLAGARISFIPMDGMGIDTERVEKICKIKSVRMVYVIPHFHHPTTVTLSSERRLHLLELAAKYKFLHQS